MINKKINEKDYASEKRCRIYTERLFCVFFLVLLCILCIASNGYTQILFQDDFELPTDFERDRTTPGWNDLSGSSSVHTLERTQTMPNSGSWSYEMTLQSASGDATHLNGNHTQDGYVENHMRVYVYLDTDYDQASVGDHQHLMGWFTTRGSAEFLDVGLNKVSSNPDRFSFTIPWQDNGGSNQDHNDLCPEGLWLERGQWYCIEIACYWGSTDAGTKLWVNGQLGIDHTGHDVTAWKPDAIWLGTCIKASGTVGTIYYDDVVHSESYIGPISGTQYTLTINTLGSGSVNLSPSGGTYNEGTVVTLTANPDLDWEFDNWSGDLSGSTNPETITMNGNKTVTAAFIYSPVQRTLTVNTSGQGSVSLDPPGGTYDDGTIVTLTATPDVDWEFSNWSGDLSRTDNPATITMDSHKSVTAVFNPEGVFEISVSSVSASTHDGNIPENTIDNNLGTRWSANGDGQWIKFDLGSSYTVAYLDIAFYNGDQRISYFDIEISENDINYTQVLTGGESSGTTTDLETFDFTDTDGRYVKIIGHENSINTWNSITEVDVWGYSGTPPPQYDLTVNVSGSGSVDLNPSGGTYNEGTIVTLTANEDAGWQFNNWNGDLTGATNPETITMNSNKNITATFVPVPQYDLTVNVSGSGSVDLNPSSGTYNEGTVITLTANADPGWQFDSWSGNLTGAANPETITMNSNKNVTATFIPVPQYDLTVNVSGSGSVDLNPSGGTYNEGTVVTLTANPDPGYIFNSWSGDLSGAVNPETITMNSNKNITATFIEDTGGGEVIHEETQTGSALNSATVTSASINGVAGNLYLAVISPKPYSPVSSVSGLGLTWTLVDEQCGGRYQTNTSVYKAQGTPSGNGSVTVTLGSSPEAVVIAVSRYSGVASSNPIGNVVSANTNGVEGACSGGTDNSSYSVDLTTSVSNAVAYSVVSRRNKTHTPGSGYTELADFQIGGGGSVAGMAIQNKVIASASTIPVDGTFIGPVDWSVVAIEIKPGGGGGPAQYDLIVNTSGSGSVDLNPSGGTYDEGTVVTLTANPDPEWQFDSWSGDLSGTINPATIAMDGNKTVIATFSQIQYDLTVNTSGSGSVNMNPSGGTYNSGTVITLTANSDPGWQFENWSGDLTGNANPETITMDANKTVTATFVPVPTYDLTVNISGSGSVNLDPSGGTYNEGTIVTLTANPDAGWQFDNWSGDLTGTTNPATITMNANKTVTTTFVPVPTYDLTVNISGSGSVDLNPSGGTYNEGTVVTLTANADPSWQLDNWSGDLSGTANPATITMDANKTVTATFVVTPQYDLTVNISGSGSVNLNPSGGTYNEGTVVTLTANADPGYLFDNWSGDLTGGSSPETITMDANKNVTATFIEDQGGTYDLNPTDDSYVRGGASADINYDSDIYLRVKEAVGENNDRHTYLRFDLSSISATVSTATLKLYCQALSNGTPAAAFVYSVSDDNWIETTITWNNAPAGVSLLDSRTDISIIGDVYNFDVTSFVSSEMSGDKVVTLMLKDDIEVKKAADFDRREDSHPPVLTVEISGGGPTQYTLSVNTSGSGSVDLNPSGGVYNSGTVVTLTANPDTEWQFDSWSGDLSGTTNPASITMDGNKTVTATFNQIQYTLTVNTSGSGNVNLNPSGGTYNSGTIVTLTANSDTGWQFGNWSGDLTGTANPATITMNANKTVTATFVPVPTYDLTVNISGSGSVNLNPSGGTYNEGTVVTLTADPDPGYLFDGWSGDLSGAVNPETITMSSNKTVTAAFIEDTGGGGVVVYEETQTGSSLNLTTVTSSNITGVNGDLYLAAISTRPILSVSSVSGLGLTWTLVDEQCGGRNQTGVSVWKAQGTTSGNGAVTATFPSTAWSAVITVSRYSGVSSTSPIGNGISGNTNGLDGACTGGTDTDNYSFNLTTTVDSTVVYNSVAIRNKLHTPGSGYTERAEISEGSGGNVAGIAIQDRMVSSPSTIAVEGTLNGITDWAVVGIELKPGSTAKALPTTEESDEMLVLPTDLCLYGNYPNPFNPSTTIRYSLPETKYVKLAVYDMMGRMVYTLVDGIQNAGMYSVTWQAADADGRALPSGVYFCRLHAGFYVKTIKMIYMR